MKAREGVEILNMGASESVRYQTDCKWVVFTKNKLRVVVPESALPLRPSEAAEREKTENHSNNAKTGKQRSAGIELFEPKRRKIKREKP